ncbi:MAG: DUF4190 domain-containing protein [Planctomycetota bacterium]|jgi:hypothetical protein
MPESAERKSKTCTLAVVSLVLGILGFFAFVVFGGHLYLCWIPGEVAASLADFLLELSFSLCDFVHPWLVLLIVPFLAISTVVFGHIAKRKIKRSNKVLTGKKLALVGLIIGYVCLPLYIFSSVVTYALAAEFWGSFEDFDESKQPWVECAIPLPDGSGQLLFMRRHIHPFMAEYDRKIRFETRAFNEISKPLPVNPGGRTKINVHWYPAGDGKGAFLQLKDRWGAYYLDLERGIVMSPKDPEFAEVFPYTTPQYLGRLDGTKSPLRFIPAGSAPEEKIRTMH